MPLCLGLDTSNYTTSAALFDSGAYQVRQVKRPLRVKEGERGLRQSDAVFLHQLALPEVLEELLAQAGSCGIDACGVSDRPRDTDGSYMPCFTVGSGFGRALSAALRIPLHPFSHQQGHIAAALYSAGALHLLERPFLAFHLSGGTTEAVLVKPHNGFFVTDRVARTLDISAGQLIDRTGVRMGLRFPCGVELDRLSLTGILREKPVAAVKGTDCCLSGIENKCMDMLEKQASYADVARFVIECVKAAVEKMLLALLCRYGDLPVLMAGGVMSNSILKAYFTSEYGALSADPEYSADNAAGTAILAAIKEGYVCPKKPY